MVRLYRRKAFLMLISDLEFILPDFDIWAQGRRGQSGGQPGVAQIEVPPNIVMLYIVGNHF